MSWMVWVAETFGQISIFLLVNYFLGQNIWNPINPNTEIVSRTKYGSFQLIVKWTSPFRPTIYINLHLNPHNFKFIQFCWIIATENRSPYIDIKRYKHEIDLLECGNNRHTVKYLLPHLPGKMVNYWNMTKVLLLRLYKDAAIAFTRRAAFVCILQIPIFILSHRLLRFEYT